MKLTDVTTLHKKELKSTKTAGTCPEKYPAVSLLQTLKHSLGQWSLARQLGGLKEVLGTSETLYITPLSLLLLCLFVFPHRWNKHKSFCLLDEWKKEKLYPTSCPNNGCLKWKPCLFFFRIRVRRICWSDVLKQKQMISVFRCGVLSQPDDRRRFAALFTAADVLGLRLTCTQQLICRGCTPTHHSDTSSNGSRKQWPGKRTTSS